MPLWETAMALHSLPVGKTRPAKATADQPIEDRVLSANLRTLYKAVLNLLGHAAYCKLGH